VSAPNVQAILAERRKRAAFPEAVQAVLTSLFERQAAFVHSPAKRKVIFAGRRAGKTHGLAARAFQAAEQFPGQTIPVFERTLTCVAADTFWSLLQEFDTKFKLGMKFHHTLRTAGLKNGATVTLLGADTIEACDKHRGGKFPVAFVDEAGTFRSKVLEYLVLEVLEPATIDYDGEIIVSGTPGLAPTGFFYGLTHAPGWEGHHWTLLENPTLGPEGLDDAARARWRVSWLAALRTRHGWTEQTPRYMREYLGLWTGSVDDRVYAFERGRNVVVELPDRGDKEWVYVLAMDLGFNDPTAFVVLAKLPDDPYIYIVESYEQVGLIPSAVAAHVERLRARYNFMSIVADTGGYGKAVAEEMVQRYGIPVKAAAKRDKRVYIEHMNGDLMSGRMKYLSRTNTELIEDTLLLPWNDEHDDSERGYRDHLPDAVLYGQRELRSWDQSLGERDAPEPGSDEWYRKEEQKMWDAVQAEYEEKHEVDDSWKDKYYLDAA
jgi:Terminase RNaseH-like domain